MFIDDESQKMSEPRLMAKIGPKMVIFTQKIQLFRYWPQTIFTESSWGVYYYRAIWAL